MLYRLGLIVTVICASFSVTCRGASGTVGRGLRLGLPVSGIVTVVVCVVFLLLLRRVALPLSDRKFNLSKGALADLHATLLGPFSLLFLLVCVADLLEKVRDSREEAVSTLGLGGGALASSS